MALNASGPISLGGSTTGESVNLELGKSATALVSMNDTDLRTLANVASGVITLPTDFYGKSTAPAYTRWYLSVSAPASNMRNVGFSTGYTVSYSNDASDKGLYFGLGASFFNPGQSPYRFRTFLMKFNTDTQTVAWWQKAPVFETAYSSTGGAQDSTIMPIGNSMYWHGSSGFLPGAPQSGFPSFHTPIDKTTGAFTGTLQATTVLSTNCWRWATHNKTDRYFVGLAANTTSNQNYVARLDSSPTTVYPFCIRNSSFATKMYPLSIDATNKIALVSCGTNGSSTGSSATFQLHELDADFNIISGYNFAGDLVGFTRSQLAAVGLNVAHNKNIVGNQKIFLAWTPTGSTVLRIARMDFSTKTIDWQIQLTSSWTTNTVNTVNEQNQAGEGDSLIATDDGGCIVAWRSSNGGYIPSYSKGYFSKISSTGAHQFTNEVIASGMYNQLYPHTLFALYAYRGSGVVLSQRTSPAANTTSGSSTMFCLNLSTDPAISNVFPTTSIGNGMTLEVTNSTDITVTSQSPTISLTTESPSYVSRQAVNASIPVISAYAGSLSQNGSFTNPTSVGGVI
jgi:hypothetical protein